MSDYAKALEAARAAMPEAPTSSARIFAALEVFFGRTGNPDFVQLRSCSPLFRQALDLLQALAEQTSGSPLTYHEALRAAQIWLRATKAAGLPTSQRMWGFDFIVVTLRKNARRRNDAVSTAHLDAVGNWMIEAHAAGLPLKRGRDQFFVQLHYEAQKRNHKKITHALFQHLLILKGLGETDISGELAFAQREMDYLLAHPQFSRGRPYTRINDIKAYAEIIHRFSAPGSAWARHATRAIYHAAKNSLGERDKGHTLAPRAIMQALKAEGIHTPLLLDTMCVSEKIGTGDDVADLYAVAHWDKGACVFKWGGKSSLRRQSFVALAETRMASIKDADRRSLYEQRLRRFLAAVDGVMAERKDPARACTRPSFGQYVEGAIARLSACETTANCL